jgi:hypothetical protein
MVLVKGQLISKGNFGVFNSPKNELKRNLEMLTFALAYLLGQNFFFVFSGELKNQKALLKLTGLLTTHSIWKKVDNSLLFMDCWG